MGCVKRQDSAIFSATATTQRGGGGELTGAWHHTCINNAPVGPSSPHSFRGSVVTSAANLGAAKNREVHVCRRRVATTN